MAAERTRKQDDDIEVEELLECPHCHSREVTVISRPEVYEFAYYCRDCGEGFD